MTTFRHASVWDRISSLSKKSSRRFVAVAFLGTGATELLSLGKGDVLVVDMSDGCVKTGRTDPREILKYLDKGVDVFWRKDLHAKVFVLGRTVIVGSTNVSFHSRYSLVEAGVETDDANVRSSAVSWINSLALHRVTPKLAKSKLKIWNPPKWGGPRRTTTKAKNTKVGGHRVWVINTKPASLEADELEQLDTAKEKAEQRLRDASRYWVDSIRYRPGDVFARDGRVGDTVIELNHDGSRITAWPPATVVYARSYKTKRGPRVGIHLERKKGQRPRQWRKFKTVAHTAGLRFKRHSDRLLSPEAQDRILKFFRS